MNTHLHCALSCHYGISLGHNIKGDFLVKKLGKIIQLIHILKTEFIHITVYDRVVKCVGLVSCSAVFYVKSLNRYSILFLEPRSLKFVSTDILAVLIIFYFLFFGKVTVTH